MNIHQHIVDTDKAGLIFPIPGKKGEGTTAYNATGDDVVAGQVVLLAYSQTVGQEVKVIAPATMAFAVRTAVALEAVEDEEIGRFQISGLSAALVSDASTIAAGRFLEVTDGEEIFSDDGGTSRATTSAAVLKDAVTAAEVTAAAGKVTKTVALIPEQHTIAAS